MPLMPPSITGKLDRDEWGLMEIGKPSDRKYTDCAMGVRLAQHLSTGNMGVIDSNCIL